MVARTKLEQLETLEELRGIAAAPPSSTHGSESTPDPSSAPKRIGRPPAPEETMQISLRLPKVWLSALRREAVKASTAEDRTISPQEIVRRLVGQGLKIDG